MKARNKIELNRMNPRHYRDLIYLVCQRQKLGFFFRIIAQSFTKEKPGDFQSRFLVTRHESSAMCVLSSTFNLSRIPGDPLLRLFLMASRLVALRILDLLSFGRSRNIVRGGS